MLLQARERLLYPLLLPTVTSNSTAGFSVLVGWRESVAASMACTIGTLDLGQANVVEFTYGKIQVRVSLQMTVLKQA